MTAAHSAEPHSADSITRVVRVPLRFQEARTMSLLDCFREAAPDLADPRLREKLVRVLRRHPELVEVWDGYSADKRTDAGPYLEGCATAFFDSRGDWPQRRLVRKFGAPAEAAADFIYREACWVLEHREV